MGNESGFQSVKVARFQGCVLKRCHPDPERSGGEGSQQRSNHQCRQEFRPAKLAVLASRTLLLGTTMHLQEYPAIRRRRREQQNSAVAVEMLRTLPQLLSALGSFAALRMTPQQRNG